MNWNQRYKYFLRASKNQKEILKKQYREALIKSLMSYKEWLLLIALLQLGLNSKNSTRK